MKTLKLFLVFMMMTFLTMSSITTAKENPPAGGENEGYLAFAEKMPAPVGGIQEIYKKIEYPEMAQKAGLQGKVFVLAFINESGGVDDVKVLKGIGGGCDEAVIEAIKTSKFEPGSHKGQVVKVKLSLSFVFKIG